MGDDSLSDFGGGTAGGWGSGSDSSGTKGFALLNRVAELIRTMGWEGLGKVSIGTIVLSFVLGFEAIIRAFTQGVAKVIFSLLSLIPGVNEAVLLGPLTFLEGAFAAATASFGSGWTGLLGPLQGNFGLLLFLVAMWQIAFYLDYVNTDVIGLVLDLPLIGSDESAAAGDEGE